jgi:hypothetical protein
MLVVDPLVRVFFYIIMSGALPSLKVSQLENVVAVQARVKALLLGWKGLTSVAPDIG